MSSLRSRNKNISISKLKKTCDKEISKLVRSKGYCEKCGKKTSLQHAHIIPRGQSLFLRYDLLNALCFCMACHLYWWHKNPIDAAEWVRFKYPERYNYLTEYKNYIVSYKREDYISILENIKQRKIRKLMLIYPLGYKNNT